MVRSVPTPCEQSVTRIKAWLADSGLSNLQIAKRAGVDEKTLRDATSKPNWNPTIRTVHKLEAAIPHDWQPPKSGKRRGAAT